MLAKTLAAAAVAFAQVPNILMGCATVLIAYGMFAGVGQVGMII